MPGFKLEQVDGDGDGEGEGEHIALPDGDSVIGRGPFLHVSDKRVSRNHGILQNVDGQLWLKPTHVNPCFVLTSPNAAPEPLEKDQWHCLKDGEIFSLLPGKYIYRVHAVGEEGTPRNSQGFEETKEEETELNWKPPRSCEETLAYTPQAQSSPSFTYEPRMRDETHTAGPAACSQAGGDSLSPCKSNAPDLPTPREKRVLPAWMMAVAPAPPNTPSAKAKRAPVRSTSSSKRSTGPKRPQPRVPSLSGDDEERKRVEEEEEEEDDEGCSKTPRKRARRQNRQEVEEDEEEDDEGCSKTPRKRARRQNRQEVEEDEEEDDEGCSKTPRKRARRQNRQEVEEDEEEDDEGCSKTRRKRARRLKSDTEESQEQDPVPKSSEDTQPEEKCTETGQNAEEEEQEEKRVRTGGSQRSQTLSLESSGNSQTNVRQKAKTQRRTPCPYGTSCYRKNPVHFQECSHPGDSDYKEEQNNKNDDDEDDDRPECPYGTDCYRKNPLHKKEYKHTKPPVNDDDGEDEDKYENSFINDDSEDEDEDMDEDSDYVPESEDSGKEDIKRLQKEAQAFIKKKKKKK